MLDFGCGFGQFLEMCRLFRMDAHGVDRSTARRSGAAVTIHAELDDVPGTFDCITMFEVLEHLHDPLGTLKALKARLNPGGMMIVEVPDTSGVDAITDETSYRKIHPLDHINAFTPQSPVAIMARIGMAPIDKEPAFVTISLKRVAKDVAKSWLKQNTNAILAETAPSELRKSNHPSFPKKGCEPCERACARGHEQVHRPKYGIPLALFRRRHGLA